MEDENQTEDLVLDEESSDFQDHTKEKILKHIAILNTTIVQIITQPSVETRVFYDLVSSRLVSDDQLKQLATLYNMVYATTALTQISSLCSLNIYSANTDSDKFYLYENLEEHTRKMITSLYDLFTFTRNDFIDQFNGLVQCYMAIPGADVDIEEIAINTSADKHHLSYLLIKLLNKLLWLFDAEYKFEIYDVYGEMVGLREIFGDRSLRELVDTYGMYLTDVSDFKNNNVNEDKGIRGADSQTNSIDDEQWTGEAPTNEQN